jgi:hypothetical protein
MVPVTRRGSWTRSRGRPEEPGAPAGLVASWLVLSWLMLSWLGLEVGREMLRVPF